MKICRGNSDEDGGGVAEKETNIEAEVDGQ